MTFSTPYGKGEVRVIKECGEVLHKVSKYEKHKTNYRHPDQGRPRGKKPRLLLVDEHNVFE